MAEQFNAGVDVGGFVEAGRVVWAADVDDTTTDDVDGVGAIDDDATREFVAELELSA
ncbi:MAG: hypothetical protein AAFY76_17505 [Cyanobacteria bacterium J06649_11]